MQYFSIHYIVLYIFLGSYFISHGQHTKIKGTVKDAITGAFIEKVSVKIKKSNLLLWTNAFGVFDFNTDLPVGEYILIVSKLGYYPKHFPILINKEEIDLGNIDLDYDFGSHANSIGTITLSRDELQEDTFESEEAFVVLQSKKEVFHKAVAYDFSSTFFSPRGLGSENRKILINGIEMNSLFNGRPQWIAWGGLNDVQRYQEFSSSISKNDYTFGSLLGVSNILMDASKYKKGTKVSYASSNRNYQGRAMITYHSGIRPKGWAFSLSLSRRYAHTGYVEGTLYDANSFFASVSKKIGKKHRVNFSGWYTPNRRGKPTAMTKEVFDIKGNTYNPNWGYQSGQIRNAKMQKIKEPTFIINHYWNISKTTTINTNIAFQQGIMTTSRINSDGSDLISTNTGEYIYAGGASNATVDPIHPNNLPSNFLNQENPKPADYQNAFLALKKLTDNGQIPWDNLVQTNLQNKNLETNSTYIVSLDKIENNTVTGNVTFRSKLNKHITINAAITHKNTKTQNYAEIEDLLGGKGFLDIDIYALSSKEHPVSTLAKRAQSDLQNTNRIVKVGDRYSYHYEIDATAQTGFLQGQFRYGILDFYIGSKISKNSYQRNGLYENGYFPQKLSLGKSVTSIFTNYGIKAGVAFNLKKIGYATFQGAHTTEAPTIRNTFINPRKNNFTVTELSGKPQESKKITTFDIGYKFRSPTIDASITAYHTSMQNASNISFFFTQGISGYNSAFVQEIMTDMDTHHIGGELGIEYQVTSTIKLKGAAAMGQFTYSNNPKLLLASAGKSFANNSMGVKDFGKVFLKGYHLSQGPQNAMQLGFEYRDPKFWWFGMTTNFFSNTYIQPHFFTRTSNFYKDVDGLPFNDYNEAIAKKLLKQKKVDDYILVHAVGGKSWRLKKYTLGFFASINNILNQNYIRGGYEQARKANYKLALEESYRKTPNFGPKYYYGYGTTYYLSCYVRF